MWLYVMLQNVVRYVVQNIVVHSCVNVVRHVICCDYFCFGGREGAKGILGCSVEDAATHCSAELLLSWLNFA